MSGRLEGIRVLVTRPRERAEELCFLLEDEGAEVLHVPLLEFLPPEDVRPLRSAAEHVHLYRWILFASASAVHALHEAMREAGTLDRVGGVKLAVVGPGTAHAARALGWEPTSWPRTAQGWGSTSASARSSRPRMRSCSLTAQDGRRELETALLEHGMRVTRVAAYRSGGRA